VRSLEQIFCPCCSGQLKVIGSRKRSCIDSLGEKIALCIRRLRCSGCRRIHHELPDLLVPYKRHIGGSIEAVITGSSDLSVAVDESTLIRWRSWFRKMADYLQGCLESIHIRYGKETAEEPSCLPKSKLKRIWHYVGNGSGWLSRIVRPVVNANLWVHTRFAFLS